jgi:AcrR family transcriptional regulator
MTGLRERKKLRTRQALVDAGLDLFMRQGFEQTTIDEIVNACEVSRRTFFRYFASKEDLFIAESDDRRADMIDLLTQRAATEPAWRSVRAAVVDLAGALLGDRRRRLARARLIARTPALRAATLEAQQRWQQALVETLSARTGPDLDVLDLHLMAGAATAALHAAYEVWTAENGHGDFSQLVEQAFDRLAYGFAQQAQSSPASQKSGSSKTAP